MDLSTGVPIGRPYSAEGAGMVIFGVRAVFALRNLKCSSIGWPEKPSLPVTLTPSLRVVTAAKAMPVSMTWRSTPSRPHRKSRCHHERRNSPSVMDCSPAASCFLMTSLIAPSSAALSSAALISPLLRRSRAAFSAAGRNRLPTWSARNGGLVRCIICLLSAPHFVRNLDDHVELGPFLVLGKHIAFL